MNFTFIVKRIILLSGLLALPGFMVVHLNTGKETDWLYLIVTTILPSIVTLPVLFLHFNKERHSRLISRIRKKSKILTYILIAGLSLTIIFQLLITFGRIIDIIDRLRFSLQFDLYCYYMTVGLVFNFTSLYKLAEPNPAVS